MDLLSHKEFCESEGVWIYQLVAVNVGLNHDAERYNTEGLIDFECAVAGCIDRTAAWPAGSVSASPDGPRMRVCLESDTARC